MFGVSCVGVGSGRRKWSDEELMKLEVGIVGAFAPGWKAGGVTNFGLLTAAGTSSKSKIRYARGMGLKEEAVQGIGCSRVAIFRPGVIGGNGHTPGCGAVLGRFIPGSWGTGGQAAIGGAFAAAFDTNEG